MRHKLRIALPAVIAVVVLGALGIAVAAPLLAGGHPGNDDFSRASVVGVTGRMFGTTRGAGAQPGEPGGSGARTVWYAWTPAQPGAAVILSIRPHNRPVTVRAFEGSTLRRLMRADRPAGVPHVLGMIDALAGVTYRIQVSGGGDFALQIVQPQGGEPVNDSPARAAPLAQAVRLAIGSGAGSQQASGTTAGARGNTVFFAFTPPAGSAGALRLSLAAVDPGRARLRISPTLMRLVPGRRALVAVSGAPAFFALRVAPLPGLRLDLTPPLVRCHVPSGWRRGNAAVRCTAGDAGSGLAHPRQRSFLLRTSVPPGAASADAATGAASVCDRAGNCAAVGPFTGLKIDRLAPAVSCEPAGASAWQQSVTVNCEAIDPPGGSGLALPSDRSFALTASLPRGRAHHRVPFRRHAPVCDLAGNCTAVPAPAPVSIDHAAPRITCGRAPRGWVSVATIACTASDGQSGLLGPDDARFTLTTTTGGGAIDPRAMTGSRSVCDRAGNCALAGPIGPIHVDRQPPLLACAQPRGWLRGLRRSIRCTVSDHGSGLARFRDGVLRLTAGVPRGGEGVATTHAVAVCDRAGNCTTAGPFTLRLDDRPPHVTCGSVPAGWQPGPVTVACTAVDLGSGVAPARSSLLLTATVPRGHSGRARFPRARFCDIAGNCALGPRLRPAEIDRRAPVVRCSRPAGGVHRHNVVVRCRASDGRGSGLANRRQARFSLRTAVARGVRDPYASTSSAVVCDRAGNCARVPAEGPFDVDRRRRR